MGAFLVTPYVPFHARFIARQREVLVRKFALASTTPMAQYPDVLILKVCTPVRNVRVPTNPCQPASVVRCTLVSSGDTTRSLCTKLLDQCRCCPPEASAEPCIKPMQNTATHLCHPRVPGPGYCRADGTYHSRRFRLLAVKISITDCSYH